MKKTLKILIKIGLFVLFGGFIFISFFLGHKINNKVRDYIRKQKRYAEYTDCFC